MEFIGKANIDDLFVKQMMDHNLKPVKVCHAGEYEREYVIIEVCHDCDLSNYALVQIVRNEEDLPNYGRCHFLTFDEIELFKGNTIKVMTCRGKDHSVKDKSGRTTHILYWNLPVSVWKESNNEVMIMERGDSVTCYLENTSSFGN